MKILHRIILLPLILLLGINLNTIAQKGVPDDFCLTDDEYRLYEMINAHRVINGLKEIPLSASLSFVARTHVIDLYTNHPDTSICNLNSWSDKGEWTACCHNKYVPQEECVRNKPKELTNYSGEGFELTYAEIFNTHPDTVFRFWKKIDEANDFMLNKGKWEDKNWRAIGVGIYKSYAVIWMGERTDNSALPEPCSTVAENKSRETREAVAAGKVTVISSITDRFYIVVASFQSLADAQSESKKYADLAGSSIKILKNNQGQYRVSINDYPSLDAAKQGKEQYKNDFSGAWILNF
jgi:hypothetical protein